MDEQPFRVVWEGSQFVNHSLAIVNRELELALLATGRVDLGVVPFEPHEFGPEADLRFSELATRFERTPGGPVEFHVRHRWPPRFDPPPAGRFILVQLWEFGRIPKDWLEPIGTTVDEVWAATQHVRQSYVDSGVDPEKLHVIPLGVNPERFHPGVTPLEVPTEKRFKFLFLGGTIWRKGIDRLLDAYRAAFSRRDDVCLVIKDMLTEGVYRGQTLGEAIRKLQADVEAPEIVYFDRPLEEAAVAGLYAACDALVHPYRGEGFGLPVAEAMACGRAPILTRGGACDDFCRDDAVYWVPATPRPVDVQATPLAGPGWVLEPDLLGLVRQMRAAFERPDECRARGVRAAEHIRGRFTWDRSAARVLERLAALRSAPARTYRSLERADWTAGAAAAFEAGQAAYRHGDLAAAEAQLIRSLKLLPSLAASHHLLGRIMRRRALPETAYYHLHRAVELDPARPAYQAALGGLLIQLGQLDGAGQHLARALALDSRNGEARAWLDELRRQQGAGP